MLEIPQVPIILPAGTVQLQTQVAGHIFQPGTNTIGMLKDKNDGSVLKHLGKPVCGAREIAFYESVKNPTDEDMAVLSNFVPEYKGTVKMIVNEKELEFIRLNDLTHNMVEPCIMDIKVGRRTYDPFATAEKIALEEQKYAACKKSIGLCIPGFQYYELPKDLRNESSNLKRFGKDFGKKLNPKTFQDALKLFLNVNQYGLCKPLIDEILFKLLPIFEWSRTQTSVKLYSSSILLAYDAQRLSDYHQNSLNNSTNDLVIQNYAARRELKNNYYIDENYRALKLLQYGLNDADNRDINIFNTQVKMIDFAHAFPSNVSHDENYLFGITNLVKIFEGFLNEIGQ